MSNLLYIKANPKPVEKSITFRISEAFLDEYKNSHKNDEIITLDLYKEGIVPLDNQMISDMFGGKDNVMIKYAKQFAECDKFIIAAPMWNLASPAILKAYFDYVSYVGITFKYTEQGAIGLLANQGKKAVHVVARGGAYSNPQTEQYEMGDKYIRTILPFFGIEDITTIPCELTNVLQGENLDNAVNAAIEKAKNIAKTF